MLFSLLHYGVVVWLCIASTAWSILLRERRSLGDLRYEVALLLTSKRTPRGLKSFRCLWGELAGRISGRQFLLFSLVCEIQSMR